MATAYLRIKPSTEPESQLVPYNGPWPPPKQVAWGPFTGIVTPIFYPEKVDHDDLNAAGIVIHHRVMFSKISDEDAEAMDHVVRGALYVDDPDTWDGRT